MIIDKVFAERQAECATMLIALARMLLQCDNAAFASWLRTIADDIETQGIEVGLNMPLASNDDHACDRP
jgi:hypothetical protein